MNAGTGKIKTVATFRGGVPKAKVVGDPNYDASAVFGTKQAVCCLVLGTAHCRWVLANVEQRTECQLCTETDVCRKRDQPILLQ